MDTWFDWMSVLIEIFRSDEDEGFIARFKIPPRPELSHLSAWGSRPVDAMREFYNAWSMAEEMMEDGDADEAEHDENG